MNDSVLHVCRTRVDSCRKVIQICWNCKKRRAMWGWFQEWYGWHITCLSCGEQWQDGEHVPRPFMPKWREENIKHARKMMAEYMGKKSIR